MFSFLKNLLKIPQSSKKKINLLKRAANYFGLLFDLILAQRKYNLNVFPLRLVMYGD